MKFQLLLLLCVAAYCHGKAYQDYYNSKTDSWTLRKYIPELKETLKKDLKLDNEDLPDLYEGLERAETPYIDLGGGCDDCTSVIQLLKMWIRFGRGYEELRSIVMPICKSITTDNGWDGDAICPGTLDNFGPHVVYILSKVSYKPAEICLKLNQCKEDEVKNGKSFIEKNLPPLKYPKRPVSTGSKSGKTPLKIVQITDVHVDLEYLEGAPSKCPYPVCCRPESGSESSTGSAGKYGDYQCNIPSSTVELFLDYMKGVQPDIVVYTGDSPPHTLWLETQEGQLKVSKWVASAITKAFNGIPVYPSLGNHETYPTNLYYTDRDDIREVNLEYGEMWKESAGFGEHQLNTIETGGFYSMVIKPGLRLISYNSLYGSPENFFNLLNEHRDDYQAMKNFMVDNLQAAREHSEKVILLGHHSLGTSDTMVHHERFMVNLLAEYGDVISLHLLGHSHIDAFRMISDPSTGQAYSVQIATPSVTTKTNINPSARVFYIDPETFTPLDQETFSLDLAKFMNGESKDAHIESSYRFTEEYGVDDMTPESFRKVVEKMESDNEMLQKYRRNFATKFGGTTSCNNRCKKSTLCGIKHSTVEGNEKCMAD